MQHNTPWSTITLFECIINFSFVLVTLTVIELPTDSGGLMQQFPPSQETLPLVALRAVLNNQPFVPQFSERKILTNFSLLYSQQGMGFP